ncbi:MAG: hypothetical protein ACOC7T_01645 [Planctomycetota bacterium]
MENDADRTTGHLWGTGIAMSRRRRSKRGTKIGYVLVGAFLAAAFLLSLALARASTGRLSDPTAAAGQTGEFVALYFIVICGLGLVAALALSSFFHSLRER